MIYMKILKHVVHERYIQQLSTIEIPNGTKKHTFSLDSSIISIKMSSLFCRTIIFEVV